MEDLTAGNTESAPLNVSSHCSLEALATDHT